jgi:primosomal protein N' (replication factor Y) (superfamily II helicase)
MLLADVALPVPVAKTFTYSVSDAVADRTVAGARVVCPFRGNRLVGVVLSVRDGPHVRGLRPVALALDHEPALPADLLAFLIDLADYYLAPIGEVMRLALPPIEADQARQVSENLRLFDPRSVGRRGVAWARATDANDAAVPLPRGQAALVLAHLRASGAEPIAQLQRRWRNARSAVKGLATAGLVAVEERDALRDPFFSDVVERDVPHALTRPQASAVEAIEKALHSAPATILLHGVTGSGKTEVYLRAIAAARRMGRGTLVLVPEIALTPQLVARFRSRFGDNVAVLHSGLTARERRAMWLRVRSGEVDVAIGARSALFAPIRSLSLVIVDEEHDSSFKQEEGVRYHARDMAILRAHRAGGVCILGSATPSLESEQLVRTGRATKLRLPDRARSQPLPRVDIVDLRRTGAGPTGDRRITMPLYRAIEETLRSGGQVIVFLNRRGFAPSVLCRACGEALTCDACSVALTFHKRSGVVRCHYCDFEAPHTETCPRCGADALALEGIGTEKLEETLATAFPGARVARLDRDVASGRATENILTRVRAREIDILVGTQMVTKGHDLPNVTLVGVVNADAALSLPDYRASERAFQLLVQVAGRAGRGDTPGRVIIQTWDPDHPAISLSATHDVDAFLERELAARRELGYPPLTRAALVRVESANEQSAQQACSSLAQLARNCDAVHQGQVVVQGPAAAPIARVRTRWRFRLMLRATKRASLRSVLAVIDEARLRLARNVYTSIDVDPVQLL